MEVSNHEDIGSCYDEIRRKVAEWLERRDLADADVAIDITGGTKPMSAALALAAVERFSHFRYVGGTKRDSGDLGAVLPGAERVLTCRNPWDKYAIREMERARELLRNYYADSAAETLRQAAARCDDAMRSRICALAAFVAALTAADRFDFRTARNTYGKCRGQIEQILNWQTFTSTEQLFKHWQAVREQTKRSDKTPSRETILELVANADRRAAQFRFDDAVGRLYRAVELHAQGLAREHFGAELGKVPITSIPSHKQEAFKKEFGDSEDGIYRLGVKQLFGSLEYGNVEDADESRSVYDRLEKHLRIRNNSLFAHGSVCVTESMFQEFRESLLRELPVKDSEIPRWPEASSVLNTT